MAGWVSPLLRTFCRLNTPAGISLNVESSWLPLRTPGHLVIPDTQTRRPQCQPAPQCPSWGAHPFAPTHQPPWAPGWLPQGLCPCPDLFWSLLTCHLCRVSSMSVLPFLLAHYPLRQAHSEFPTRAWHLWFCSGTL